MTPDGSPETAADQVTDGPPVTPSHPEPHGLPPILYPILAGIFGGALVWAYSRILLAVSTHTIKLFGHSTDGKTVAAAIGLLVPLNILIGAALVAYGARVRRRPAAFPLLVGAAVIVIAAGVVAVSIKAPAEAPTVHTVALAAQNTAFQPTTLTLSAGEKVQIKFENKDAGVQHNVVLFDGGDANAPQLFQGPVVTGPATTTYSFTAPRRGPTSSTARSTRTR